MRRLMPLVFLLSALALTWPLALSLTTHLPQGSEPAATVPYLNLWTVGWNGQRLRAGLAGYWDAPIFHPTRGTLAFSDPQPLTALPAALLWPRAPALTYNLILLLYLTLTGITGFWLARSRGLARPLALAAGLFLQALPFLTHERGVLQLQPLFGPLLVVGLAWRTLEAPSLRRGLALGLAAAVTYLTSEYFALLALVAAGLALPFAVRGWRERRLWGALALAGGVAAAATLPVALPQARALAAQGFVRSEATLARTSARPVDYLRPSPRLRLEGLWPEVEGGSGQRLYPGLAATALAGAGLLAAWRGGRRRWGVYLAALALVGGAMSLGPNLRLGTFAPYLWLHRLPGLTWTRSPFRFALLVQLGLALLAVEAMARLGSRRLRWAVLAAVLVLAEWAPRPEPLAPLPEMNPGWAAALRRAGVRVVVHLPWAEGRAASAFEDTARWMVQSLPAGLRLVNGYSGFFPPMNNQLRDLLEGLAEPWGWEALRALGVEAVVVHEGALSARGAQALADGLAAGEIEALAAAGEASVYRLRGSAFRPVTAYSGPWRLELHAGTAGPVLEAFATGADPHVYVYVPGVTPPGWALELVGESEARRVEVEPRGTTLVYSGAARGLALPLPGLEGVEEIRLLAAGTGEVLGELRP